MSPASRRTSARGATAIRQPDAQPPNLAASVLPAATAAALLARLADRTGQAVGFERPLTREWIIARPGEGLVDADGPIAPPEDADAARLVETARQIDAAALTEKLAAMAELAAGAGHEVNNPLATIVSRAGRLLAGETDPDRRRQLAQIVAEAHRGRDMIGDLMLFARPPQPTLDTVDPAAVLAEVEAEFAEDLTEAGLTLAVRVDRPPGTATELRADRTQLAIVWSELLRNALRHAPAGSAVRVVITGAARGECVRLQMTDDGPGLTPEQRRHLFDPFYSGRQAGRGLGFGLPKCWRIVEQHGGQIAAASPPMQITIDWPEASPRDE